MTWAEIERIVRAAAGPLRSMLYAADRGFDRDDLLQEGRIAVWQALQRVPDSHAGYLTIRARGAMVDALRQWSWIPRSAYGDDVVLLDADDETVKAQFRTPDVAPGAISARQVIEAMRQLPDQQHIVVDMLAAGAAPVEIAARLGVSTARVSQIKSQLEVWARRRLEI